MPVDQPDKKRLALAALSVVVASIFVLIAIAALVTNVTDGNDSSSQVEAVGSNPDPLSPGDITRPERAQDDDQSGSDSENQQPRSAISDDVVTIGETDILQPVDAPEDKPATDGSADVLTGEYDDLASSEPGTSKPETNSTNETATSTMVSSITAASAPAETTDSQAPTNQSAPGTNKTELYVDKQTGSGRNPGTKELPFRRPIEATSIAEPGTTIYLRAGTYDTNTDGALVMTRSGTAQNWIRVAAYPGERVELVSGGLYGSGFEVIGASYIEVADFIIRGRSDSIHGNGVFIKDQAHDVRIINNEIQGFGGAGISVYKSSNITLERNEVRDNAQRSSYQGSGITIFEPTGPTGAIGGDSIVIRGNYVVRNYNATPGTDGRITDGNCIILDRFNLVGFEGKTLVENNVCVENGGRGIHMFKSSNALIRNNTLVRDVWSPEVESGRGELTAGHGTNISFINNLIFNRSGVASFIDTNNQNISFTNNFVASGPPPGEGNQLLSGDISKYFSSTDQAGSVEQFRPLPGSGLAGSADGSSLASHDLTGRERLGSGSVGALEP